MEFTLLKSRDITTFAADARWQLTQRIASSPRFVKAARLKQFLLFVVEMGITGREDEISEHTIGTEVFGRDLGYKGSDDNVVRVSARQVRIKLKEYFDEEGASETLRLEMPRGSYVPVFRELPGLPPPAVVQEEPSGFRKLHLASAVLVATGLAAGFLIGRTSAPAPVSSGTPSAISRVMGQVHGPITFVLADIGLGLMGLLDATSPELETYANRKYLTSSPDATLSGSAGKAWKAVQRESLTNYANVFLLTQILKSSPDLGSRLLVKHARDVQMRDFHDGNFVLVGGPAVDPWINLFETRLVFQFGRDEDRNQVVLLNKSPQPGEIKEYFESNGTGYARVAAMQTPSGSGRVLLIGSTSIGATEAAVEFLLNQRSIAEISAVLAGKDLAAANFELLLKTFGVGESGSFAKIIAHRQH